MNNLFTTERHALMAFVIHASLPDNGAEVFKNIPEGKKQEELDWMRSLFPSHPHSAPSLDHLQVLAVLLHLVAPVEVDSLLRSVAAGIQSQLYLSPVPPSREVLKRWGMLVRQWRPKKQGESQADYKENYFPY